jgi:hypothetical protein
MFEDLFLFVRRACQERDLLKRTVSEDKRNHLYQAKIAEFEAGSGFEAVDGVDAMVGFSPSGRTARRLARLRPAIGYSELELAYQKAAAEAIDAGLGAHILPKLDKALAAHKALLDDAQRSYEAAAGTEALISLKAHGEAFGDLAQFVNAQSARVDQETTSDDPDQLFSPAKLADRLGIPANDTKRRDAVRKRLEKWRKANLIDGGWIEVADPKPREPRYLYPLGKVWPVIEDMKHSG